MKSAYRLLGGGFLAQNVSWQWDFWLPAIITSFSLLLAIFCFPETLFSRDPVHLAERKWERSYWDLLFSLRGNMSSDRGIHVGDFFHNFRMLRYPSVIIPVWWYTWCWTFVNILPALTMSQLYTTIYHFNTGAIGLCLGIPLLIGTLLGEITGGKLSDYMMSQFAKHNNGVRKPEQRLYITTIAAIMMPAGIIMFGVCVQEQLYYIIPLIGLSISKKLCYLITTSNVYMLIYLHRCVWPSDCVNLYVRIYRRLLQAPDGRNGRAHEPLPWSIILFSILCTAVRREGRLRHSVGDLCSDFVGFLAPNPGLDGLGGTMEESSADS
jgi:MFS family permease